MSLLGPLDTSRHRRSYGNPRDQLSGLARDLDAESFDQELVIGVAETMSSPRSSATTEWVSEPTAM